MSEWTKGSQKSKKKKHCKIAKLPWHHVLIVLKNCKSWKKFGGKIGKMKSFIILIFFWEKKHKKGLIKVKKKYKKSWEKVGEKLKKSWDKVKKKYEKKC